MSELPTPRARCSRTTLAEALRGERLSRRKRYATRPRRATREGAQGPDELHRDVTDGGGPLGLVSRFDPYPLSPSARSIRRRARAPRRGGGGGGGGGAAGGPPPLPRVDASLEGSEIVQGLAAWEYAKAKGEADAERVAKEEEARAEYRRRRKGGREGGRQRRRRRRRRRRRGGR